MATPTPPWPTTTTVTTASTSVFVPPLTTQFTQPRSCTWTYDINSTEIAWLDFDPDPDNTSTQSCYPSGMFGAGSWGVFSPGSCPQGWSTVDTVNVETQDDSRVITTATCCSTNFTLVNPGGYCGRVNSSVLAVPMNFTVVDGDSTITDVMTESTTMFYGTIAVHTILALWEEEDQDSVGVTGEDAVEVVEKEHDLSTESKIGIAVGSAVAAILLAALIYLIVVKRRKMKEPPPQRPQPRESQTMGPLSECVCPAKGDPRNCTCCPLSGRPPFLHAEVSSIDEECTPADEAPAPGSQAENGHAGKRKAGGGTTNGVA